MPRLDWRLCTGFLLAAGCLAQTTTAQRPLTWQETEEKFKANNPTLLAGKLTIDESRADEITAYLRPNPDFTFTADGTQIYPSLGVWRPLSGTFYSPALDRKSVV